MFLCYQILILIKGGKQMASRWVGNLKFLLFEITIKMVSLYLMTKTAKITTHAAVLNKFYHLSYLCTSKVVEKFLPVRSSEYSCMCILLTWPAWWTRLHVLHELIFRTRSWFLVCGFFSPLLLPMTCMTYVLDLQVAELVERGQYR